MIKRVFPGGERARGKDDGRTKGEQQGFHAKVDSRFRKNEKHKSVQIFLGRKRLVAPRYSGLMKPCGILSSSRWMCPMRPKRKSWQCKSRHTSAHLRSE